MKSIILAGGSGTRLWPISRNSFPKQFIKLNGEKVSLFQETFLRSLMLSDIENIYVITNEKYKYLVASSIEELGYTSEKCNIIVEPEAKNTLAAIYAGVHEISKSGDDIVAVFPSDHVITKNFEFVEAIKSSAALALNKLITFGIKPDSPNTGYGYISPGESFLNGYIVNSFKEKPSIENALKYIGKGYLWNAGIFMFETSLFTQEVSIYAPEIFNAFNISHDIKEAFNLISNKISIDYGIMEKSRNVAVVPVDIGWNDLGSFDAFYDVYNSDANNNIISGNNIIIDSSNLLVQSKNKKIVTAIGVDDLIIIDEDDALLICKKNSSQLVKDVVNILNNNNDNRINYGSRTFHDWGRSDMISQSSNYKLINILVNKHKYFQYIVNEGSEHWILISGKVMISTSEWSREFSEGDSFVLKTGETYLIKNLEESNVEIIKINIGIKSQNTDYSLNERQ